MLRGDTDLRTIKKDESLGDEKIFYTFVIAFRKWPRSLVNRASDSGSEGRAFESHRGHMKIP